MQEKLDEQSEKLAKAEERLRYYDSLAGWRTAQSLNNLYLLSVCQARKVHNLPVSIMKLLFIVIYSLMSWACQVHKEAMIGYDHLVKHVMIGYDHLVKHVRDSF